MKKYLLILLTVFSFLNLGSTDKYEYKYQPDFAPFVYEGINDSIPTVDVFGRVRNGIIAQNIIDVLNTDPSGVDLTETEMAYVRSIVGGLYVIGVWQKSVALYGFVGGNEWKHKWNWKDLRDLDAAYRMVFLNTTHNSTGLVFNGNGNANTFFNPFVESTTDATIVHYTSNYVSGYENGLLFNSGSSVNRFLSGNINSTTFFSQFRTNIYSATVLNGRGCKISTTSSAGIRGFKNGLKIIDNSSVSGNFPNENMRFGCRYASSGGSFNPDNYFTGTQNFIAMSNQVLTDQQAIQTSNVVTFAQGILSRQ